MRLRKKKILDGIDRDILRVLQKRRPLVSRQIARYVGISAVAITPRLLNLKNLGILKVAKKAKVRTFRRNFGKKIIEINAPRSIHWDFDLVNDK